MSMVVGAEPDKSLPMTGAEATELLRSGCATSFNRFREHFPLWKPDLAGQNLSVARLHEVNLSEARLCGADLRGADLSEVLLNDADLTGADLRGARLSLVSMVNAKLIRADLRSVSWTFIKANYADFADALYDPGLFEAEEVQIFLASGLPKHLLLRHLQVWRRAYLASTM